MILCLKYLEKHNSNKCVVSTSPVPDNKCGIRL